MDKDKLLMSVIKVVSGGQTGVDQAALRAAQESGLFISGWCPPGKISETGLIPSQFPLIETPQEYSELAPNIPRSLRTEWNVRDSDATLILCNPARILDLGTEFTAKVVVYYDRPLIICDPIDSNSTDKIIAWLQEFEIKILNVAGPSESQSPGIGNAVYNLLVAVFNYKF